MVLGDVILLIVWLTVVIYLYKRGQMAKLASSIKISIAFYFLQMIAETIKIIYYQRKQFNWLHESIVLTWSIFYLNHWIFTWHYLEAASLFKLTFGQHSVSNLNLIQKRKRNMHIINILGIIYFCAEYVFLAYFAINS